MDNTNNSTESPVVAFTNVKSVKGFNWSYTMRGATGKEILEKMEKFEDWCLENKWTANELNRGGFAKKEKEYAMKDGNKIQCPQCKTGFLLKKISTKTGKEFRPCENGKYNAITKQTEGCTYTDWLNPPQTTIPMTVAEYDNYQG